MISVLILLWIYSAWNSFLYTSIHLFCLALKVQHQPSNNFCDTSFHNRPPTNTLSQTNFQKRYVDNTLFKTCFQKRYVFSQNVMFSPKTCCITEGSWNGFLETMRMTEQMKKHTTDIMRADVTEVFVKRRGWLHAAFSRHNFLDFFICRPLCKAIWKRLLLDISFRYFLLFRVGFLLKTY